MKFGALAGGMAGLGLSIWLLDTYGVGKILELLGSAGLLGFTSLVAFHAIQMCFSALGWRAIAPPVALPIRLTEYLRLRWIREGINNLLPLAQIGGEFIAARILQLRGERLGTALAGTVADLTLEMGAQLLFTLLGLALLLLGVGGGVIVQYVGGGLCLAAMLALLAGVALRMGAGGLAERGLLRLGRWLGWAGVGGIEGFNAALLECYGAPGRVALSTFWHLVSWLSGGVEVCIALYFLGHQIGIEHGLVIESIGQALKAVGFAIPGALGIQEGGYVLICQAFGLSPDVALALSLLKRLREIALGAPALVAWQRSERAATERSSPLPGVFR